MAKQTIQTGLRVEPELHAALLKVAEKEKRSLNQIQVILLEEALQARGVKPKPPAKA